jgi:hypothetical protein
LGNASTAWCDYDNDGDPDLAMIGFSSVTAEISLLYRNDGNGIFTLVDSLLTPASSGSLNWGDYDHDGDPDLLVNGQHGGGGPIAVTTLYRNDGNSIFTPVASGLPGLSGVARWIDYDMDGWLDVLMIGYGNTISSDSTRLFHNDTNGVFTEVPVNLPGYDPSDISIVDFNNDSLPDFFVIGGTTSTTMLPVSDLYQNNGGGNFSKVPFNFMKLSTGTSSWADYDNDGDKDLLYDGIDSTAGLGFTQLYRNDGNGNFSNITIPLPGSGEPGSVDWADIDNDGDLDILIGGPTMLLRNDGNNVYTDITPSNVQFSVPNSFADIDNDGDVDFLLISQSGGPNASTIYRNELLTGLVAAPANADFVVFPNPASDHLTIQSNSNFNGNLAYALYNSLGLTVASAKIQKSGSSPLNIHLPNLPAGLYYFKILENGVDIQNGNVIIENPTAAK